MAYFIKPNEEPIEISPIKDGKFTLEEMQFLVGGYIEMIASSDNRFVLIVNEEGKLRNMARNTVASKMATKMLMAGDYVVGPAVIATRLEAGFDESEVA